MVEIQNLTKYYGSKAALKGISFTIKENEVLGFLGPNGAGKSTTLNIMAGVIPSTGGTVKIQGYDIAQQPVKAKKCIGFLPEIPPVYPDMKVREYLHFAAGLKGIPAAKRKGEVERVMERLKITDVQKRLIRNLSKGYKQRVGFAMAILGDPPVLILDEPTVGLDPTQLMEVRNLILDLRRNHAIILSSHILGEISAVCDRIVIINHGEIKADDTIERLEEADNSGLVLKLKIQGSSREVPKIARAVEGVVRVDNIQFVQTGIYTYDIELENDWCPECFALRSAPARSEVLQCHFLYDDRMLITFNYKDGTQTVRFEDTLTADCGEKSLRLRSNESPSGAFLFAHSVVRK